MRAARCRTLNNGSRRHIIAPDAVRNYDESSSIHLTYTMAPFPPLSMNKAKAIFIAVVSFVLPIEYGQSQTSPRLRNATVLIIRHAEKPETGKHLSPAGVSRAQAYVSYFKSLRIDS